MLKWTSNRKEMELESKIADKALGLLRFAGIKYSKLDMLMDIDACHSNGNPLRLQDLLNAPSIDFAHDVLGIRRNINRKTGKLENCFVPRYSK